MLWVRTLGTRRLRVTKNSLWKKVNFKVEMTQQRTNRGNCWKSQPVHHVNTFAQQHLEYNMLHRACKPVCVWWDFVVTADSIGLLLTYAGLSRRAVICADTRFLTNGIAADIGSELIRIPYYIYIPGSCLCVYRHTVLKFLDSLVSHHVAPRPASVVMMSNGLPSGCCLIWTP